MHTTDIKFYKAENTTQNDEGGGRISGAALSNGGVGGVHGIITEAMRTVGNLSLSKLFAAVSTNDTEAFQGAHVIVAKTPDDPNVFWWLTSTVSPGSSAAWFDRRTAAKAKIEQYYGKFGRFGGSVYGRQYIGQNGLTLWQRLDQEPPKIGYVYVLVEISSGEVRYQQSVKVDTVNFFNQTFYEGEVAFVRRVCICGLTTALAYDFTGVSPSRNDPPTSSLPTDFLTTRIVDAARYYSCKPLLAATNTGDFSVLVGDTKIPLAPNATAETALGPLDAAGNTRPLAGSAGAAVSFTSAVAIGPNKDFYLGTACWPGTVSIDVGSAVIADDGNGNLVVSGASIGTVRYADGILSFASSSPTFAGDKTFSYLPAAAPIAVNETARQAVTQATRGFTWIITLEPVPAPGTVTVSYRAGGVWYSLRDTGAGVLKGADSSYGSGDIKPGGVCTLRTNALPDEGSDVIWQWATNTLYFNRSGIAPPAPRISGTTAHGGVAPGQFGITWLLNGVAKSATDDGHGGLVGDGAGGIRYATGDWYLTPDDLPNPGTVFTLTYQYGSKVEETFNGPARDGNGHVQLTLANQDLLPGTVEVEFNVQLTDYEVASWADTNVSWVAGTKVCRPSASTGLFDGGVAGIVDYANGMVDFLPEFSEIAPKPQFVKLSVGVELDINSSGDGFDINTAYRTMFSNFEYITVGATMPQGNAGHVTVRYRVTAGANAETETATLENLELDLTYRYAEQIVDGSVLFDLGGRRYVHSNGVLYTDFNHATGSGTVAGSLNLATGVGEISIWTPGQSNTLALLALTTQIDAAPTDGVTMRTPIAPLRPGLTAISATLMDGTHISETVSAVGAFDGPHIQGAVDSVNGIVQARFGAWVTPTQDDLAAWWYNAEAVRGDGKVFKSSHVVASSVKLTAVAVSTLPLDASIIGVDPVSLPSDCKVPWVRRSDMVVVFHDAVLSIASMSAGAVHAVGRPRIARVALEDSVGTPIPLVYAARDPVHGILLDRDGQSAAAIARSEGKGEDQVLAIIQPLAVAPDVWTFDLVAGHLEVPATPDLTGLTGPFSLSHSIEDTRLVNAVDISGRITFTAPLRHAFPLGAKVASALYLGDLQARYTNLFTQQTWTGAWSDAVVGSEAVAQYDDLNYPIEVKNNGCQEERWAIIITSAAAGDTPAKCKVVGENLGILVKNHSIGDDIAIANPATATPYFTLRAGGWGLDWPVNACLRFNTHAGNKPLWCGRTVLQGDAAVLDDGGALYLRGNSSTVN